MTHPAVTTYLEREKAANAKPQGADHKAILADVARETGIEIAELRSMVLDETNNIGYG